MALVPPAGRRTLPLVFPTPPGRRFPARREARAPVAFVKLAEGCDRDCSFCAIPSFRGGFRSRRPTEVLRKAVKGMLPKNKLADAQLRKLKIYAGTEHPHAAQAPKPLELS